MEQTFLRSETNAEPEVTILVEQARAGDMESFEALGGPYQELAFRAAYLITQNADDAQDAVQEALVKSHRALKRFRNGSPFRPWLLKIVTNEAQDRRISARRRIVRDTRAHEASTALRAEDAPEALLLASERKRDLLQALRRLSEQDQVVVIYRYFLDLSETEIAEVLGCPKGTVKSRLSRALLHLRKTLANRAEEIFEIGVVHEN